MLSQFLSSDAYIWKGLWDHAVVQKPPGCSIPLMTLDLAEVEKVIPRPHEQCQEGPRELL